MQNGPHRTYYIVSILTAFIANSKSKIAMIQYIKFKIQVMLLLTYNLRVYFAFSLTSCWVYVCIQRMYCISFHLEFSFKMYSFHLFQAFFFLILKLILWFSHQSKESACLINQINGKRGLIHIITIYWLIFYRNCKNQRSVSYILYNDGHFIHEIEKKLQKIINCKVEM